MTLKFKVQSEHNDFKESYTIAIKTIWINYDRHQFGTTLTFVPRMATRNRLRDGHQVVFIIGTSQETSNISKLE